jgi:hypothetical protein
MYMADRYNGRFVSRLWGDLVAGLGCFVVVFGPGVTKRGLHPVCGLIFGPVYYQRIV